MSQKAKGFGLVILSAVVFGMVPLFVQSINGGGSNAIMTAFLRYVLVVPPLYIWLRMKKIPLALTKKECGQILLITIFGYGGTTVLLFSAYQFIPTGIATTVHFVYPVFVILGSMIFLKEKVSPMKIFCAGLCFGGILLFYGGDGGASIQPLGLLLAFASGITYSFYTIYLGRGEIRKMDPMKLIFYMHALGSVLILALTLSMGRFTLQIRPYAWILAAVTALLVSVVAVLPYQKGVHLIGPQNAALLSTFEPVTSLVVGVLAYDETVSLSSLAGCVLILSSVIIVARMKVEPKNPGGQE